MPKIVKGAPSPHIIVVDTNVLWIDDKSPPVNPAFDEFWEQHEEIAELELVVPYVVRGELLYQQTTSLLKSLDKVQQEFEKISSITAVKRSHRLSEERLRADVAAKFDKWLKMKKGRVVEIPYPAINWPAIVQAAIWRRPPFTADSKNPDIEKGFRDALILESVAALAGEEKRPLRIAFVCDDKMLRDTTAGRMTNDQRFVCYENLEALSSYLKLTHQRLTDTFIKGILRRAAKKFLSADPTCLWHREKIGTLIQEEARPLFENPTTAPPTTAGSVFLTFLAEPWTPIEANRAWITAPQFDHLSGDREYHWKSLVTNVREYQQSVSGSPLAYSYGPDRKVLFVRHIVSWQANVKADGRFQRREAKINRARPCGVSRGDGGRDKALPA